MDSPILYLTLGWAYLGTRACQWYILFMLFTMTFTIFYVLCSGTPNLHYENGVIFADSHSFHLELCSRQRSQVTKIRFDNVMVGCGLGRSRSQRGWLRPYKLQAMSKCFYCSYRKVDEINAEDEIREAFTVFDCVRLNIMIRKFQSQFLERWWFHQQTGAWLCHG